jgi:hypothetical protein
MKNGKKQRMTRKMEDATKSKDRDLILAFTEVAVRLEKLGNRLMELYKEETILVKQKNP